MKIVITLTIAVIMIMTIFVTCLWRLIVQVSVVLRKTVGESDYTNLDDQPQQTCHDSPRFKPFTYDNIYDNKR